MTDLPEGSRDTALASFVLLLSFLDRPVHPYQLRQIDIVEFLRSPLSQRLQEAGRER